MKSFSKILILLMVLMGCEGKPEMNNITIGDLSENNLIYRNLDPKIIISYTEADEFSMDINNDSVVDLIFRSDADLGNFYFQEELSLGTPGDDMHLLIDTSGIMVCEPGDIITCSDILSESPGHSNRYTLAFHYSSSVPIVENDSIVGWNTYYNSNGNWIDVEEKYMAFVLYADLQWYAGWIKMGFNSEGKLEIDEYAYKQITGC